MRRLLLAVPMIGCLLFAQSATELRDSVGLAGEPRKAAFVENYLVTANESNLAIIDLTNGLTVRHLPQGSLVEDFEASPAGHLMAVGTCDHAIQIWDTNSWTLVRRFALQQECAESVSFSPDGALLATGAYGCASNEAIQVWDVSRGKLTAEIAPGTGFRNVVFGGNGSWIAGVDDKGMATVFAWPSGQKLRTFVGLDHAGSGNFRFISSPDGRYLAWAGESLRVWDLISGKELQLPGEPRDKRRSPHGILVVNPGQKPAIHPSTAEFLSDGRLAYADEMHGQLVTIQLSNGTTSAQPLIQSGEVMFGDVGYRKPQEWLRIRRDGKLIAGTIETRTVARRCW